MLNFAEELLLVVLDERTGEFGNPRPIVFEHALAGAVLMDLALQNRIDTDVRDLFVIRPDPTGDPVLDPVLARIGLDGQTRPTRHWVQAIGGMGGQIREAALAQLVAKGVLRCEERRFLWVFSSRRYPTLDGAGRQEVKGRLRELLLGDGLPDPRDVVLVSLLSACRLFGEIFDEAELARAQPRIRAVARMDLIGQAIAAIIGEIEREVSLALGHLG
jgi:hypothetical protein